MLKAAPGVVTVGRQASPEPEGASKVARARIVLLEAVWHGKASRLVEDTHVLVAALEMARRNLVEAALVGTYADHFPFVQQERLQRAARTLWRNLREVGSLLSSAGVPAVLIKSGIDLRPQSLQRRVQTSPNVGLRASEYGDFDLVVGHDYWSSAVRALDRWGKTRTHRIEPGKLMVSPADGPAAHLHRAAGWFGVPVLPTQQLRARARPAHDLGGLLLPAPPDELRIWLAHAAFQELAFDLSELVYLRPLASAAVLAEAQVEAEREGWPRAFRAASQRAAAAMQELDAGRVITLPVLLSPAATLVGGAEHGINLLRSRHLSAGCRGLLVNPLLVAAKRRPGRRQ
jgi:hypothetical protein